MHEARRLSRWSLAVRGGATIKRLRLVPAGRECWAPVPAAMTFADAAHNLVEADLWLLRTLRRPDLPPIVGSAGEAGSPGALGSWVS